MKASKKVDKLDREFVSVLIVISVGASKFVEHSIRLLAKFVTFTVLGMDVTMWLLYCIVTTVFITLWFLE